VEYYLPKKKTEVMSSKKKKIDGTRDHHVQQNKPDSERQTSCVFSIFGVWILKKDIKVEGGLFRKRKRTSRRGEDGQKMEMRSENDQCTLYTYMKML
jgi:hypothetical protein